MIIALAKSVAGVGIKDIEIIDGDLVVTLMDGKQFVNELPSGSGDGGVYISKEPSTVTVGGLQTGFVTGDDGIAVTELIDQMLHPFIYPSISISLDEGTGLFEYGTEKILNYIIVYSHGGSASAFSEDKISLSVGGRVLNETEYTKSVNGDTCNLLLNPRIVNDGTNNVAVTVNATVKNKTLSATSTYEFVHATYSGVTSKTIDTVTEADILGATKEIRRRGNIGKNFTADNESVMIAIPKTFGTFSKIIDQNGFDITGSFAKRDIDIKSIPYTVYINNKGTITNFGMTFNY